jgi:hemolysin activation/secretion protein
MNSKSKIIPQRVQARHSGGSRRPAGDDRISGAVFEQSSLGGQNNLRGFGLDRYIDKHLIAFSIEERIHILRTKLAGVTADFEVAPFLDTGQVFNSFKDVSFQDYRMTPGLGFRAIVRPNVVGRVDYGYSREGGAVFAGLDFPY